MRQSYLQKTVREDVTRRRMNSGREKWIHGWDAEFNNGRLDRLSVGFGGDLSHGHTVRSLSLALSHFENITIRWAAEEFLGMPPDLAHLLATCGVKVIRERSVRDVMNHVSFYYMTRPQLERMPGVSQNEGAWNIYSIGLDGQKRRKITGRTNSSNFCLSPLLTNR